MKKNRISMPFLALVLALVAPAFLLLPLSTHAAGTAGAKPAAPTISLFDGKTLNGWIEIQNNPASIGGADILNLPAFVQKLSAKADPVSAYLHDRLDAPVRASLATCPAPDSPEARPYRNALARELNKIVSGTSIYDQKRFARVTLKEETRKLLSKPNPQEPDKARLNKLLIEDAYPDDLVQSPPAGWIVKNGVIASTGAGRGVLYTEQDFTRYRITFSVRQAGFRPGQGHQPGVLIFCTRPKPGEKPLDALGGIQFQVPNGGHWDYRPGVNKAGKDFTRLAKAANDNKQWSRVEILVDATKGTARMTVASPVGGKPEELLRFSAPEAGKPGPFALQMHNAGLFDEFKDITVEIDPPDL